MPDVEARLTWAMLDRVIPDTGPLAPVDRLHELGSDRAMDLGGITIRHAVLSDADTIASLHTASWRAAYAAILDPTYLAGPIEDDRRSLWSERFERPDAQRTILVAETADAAVLGFVCVYRDLDPEWGSLIDNLHVAPHLRGRRIGSHLMKAAARCIEADAEAQRMHLSVFEANDAALQFYLRLGGQIVERCLSDMPTSRGAAILRVFWPNITALTA